MGGRVWRRCVSEKREFSEERRDDGEMMGENAEGEVSRVMIAGDDRWL